MRNIGVSRIQWKCGICSRPTLDLRIGSETRKETAKMGGIRAEEGEGGYRKWMARDHKVMSRYLDEDIDVSWRGVRYSGRP